MIPRAAGILRGQENSQVKHVANKLSVRRKHGMIVQRTSSLMALIDL
jgi:hypothetical protein